MTTKSTPPQAKPFSHHAVLTAQFPVDHLIHRPKKSSYGERATRSALLDSHRLFPPRLTCYLCCSTSSSLCPFMFYQVDVLLFLAEQDVYTILKQKYDWQGLSVYLYFPSLPSLSCPLLLCSGLHCHRSTLHPLHF